MKKTMLLVGAIALLSGMGLNLQYALDDYNLCQLSVNQVVAQSTTGDLNPGDDEVYSGLLINCYDSHGNITGHRYTCFRPGYLESCLSHGCQ